MSLTSLPQLNGEMLSANARIAIRHGWESKWYEWPLNLRGLLYYSKDREHGFTESVYLIGEQWSWRVECMYEQCCFRLHSEGLTSFGILTRRAALL